MDAASSRHYRLADDSYIVDGQVYSVIYDLGSGQLHRINANTRSLLLGLLDGSLAESRLGDREQALVASLEDKGIIVPADSGPNPPPDIRSLKTEASKPAFAWIEVTRTCNLKCAHCYEECSPQEVERMSLEDYDTVAARLQEQGVDAVQFIGGEPLILKADLVRMLEDAVARFSYVEVYTNATLINDHWAGVFQRLGVRVALSIYSDEAALHDSITAVSGSHRRLLKGIERLESHGIRYRASAIETADIRNPQISVAANVSYDLPRLVGRGGLDLYDRDMFAKKAITADRFTRPVSKDEIASRVSGHNCFQSKLYIDTDLNVYPCVMERRRRHGNLRNGKLPQVLSTDILGFNKDAIEGCRDCEYRYACFDCRPDANGKAFGAKPWYCLYEPGRGKWRSLDEAYERLRADAQDKGLEIAISA